MQFTVLIFIAFLIGHAIGYGKNPLRCICNALSMFSLRNFFIAIIGSAVIINLVFWDWESNLMRFVPYGNKNTKPAVKIKGDILVNVKGECALPVLDPWDLRVKQFLNPQKDPLKGCNVSFERRSFIDSDGYLWIYDATNRSQTQRAQPESKLIKKINNFFGSNKDELEEKCRYRCVDSKDGWHLIYGNWTDVPEPNLVKPECEIFEVQCFEDDVETYKYLHSQIIPKSDLPIEPTPNAPDMHIILIDSASTSQVLRAMPLTTHYLRTDMEALVFKYMNRVGINSRPNAYSLLFGEQAADLEANPWGPKKVVPGREEDICKKELDTENFIFYDYKEQGYTSMWAEDWGALSVKWPSCKGFTKKPADHFMLAYDLRFWENKTEGLYENLFDKSCRESHNYLLDIIQDFIQKYDDKPKVSLSWMVNLAHNNGNGLYHADANFKDFFVKMKSKLANSFVFFMADHGNRHLVPKRTDIGKVEISNSFLFLILPEKLRKNTDLMEQLYRNTDQLTTHYDVYATFLEIATNGSQWDEKTDFSSKKYSHWNRTLYGSSLLHPLNQPRTCESLKIPFEYCICQHEYTEFEDPEISFKIADVVVKRMNDDIKASEFASKCVELEVNRTATEEFKLQEYESQGKRRIFHASIQTSPSQGQYDAFAEYENGVVTLISTRFFRNDEYAEQTKCIPENFIRNYCYCKDLLKGNKT